MEIFKYYAFPGSMIQWQMWFGTACGSRDKFPTILYRLPFSGRLLNDVLEILENCCLCTAQFNGHFGFVLVSTLTFLRAVLRRRKGGICLNPPSFCGVLINDLAYDRRGITRSPEIADHSNLEKPTRKSGIFLLIPWKFSFRVCKIRIAIYHFIWK